MYDSPEVATKIRNAAKSKNISVKDVLTACDLGINTLSHMNHGRAIASDSLAKIADYLDCSVDYLLGRTEETQVQNALELEPEEYPVVLKYRAISDHGREIVDKLLDDLHKNKNAPTTYSDERIEAILQNKPELTELANQIRMLDRDQTLRAIDYIQYLLAQQDKN